MLFLAAALESAPENPYLTIILVVIGLVVLLGVLKFIFKLTAKVLACGCSAILFLAIALALMSYFGNQ